jgi:hypothetical protein
MSSTENFTDNLTAAERAMLIAELVAANRTVAQIMVSEYPPRSERPTASVRAAYDAGHRVGMLWKGNKITTVRVTELRNRAVAGDEFSAWLAGYRDVIDYYNVNHTAADWERIATRYFRR